MVHFIQKPLAPLSLAAALLMAGAMIAEAGWSRKGSGVGPRGGTWSYQGSGSCAGGTCSSQQTLVGPNGGVTTREGSRTCSGGTCSSSATVTGPGGHGYTRNSTFTRN